MTPGPGIFRTELPIGFTAGGVHSGIRRYRPDLGLIVSEESCVAAGLFTQNTCPAAPVMYSKNLLPATNIKAIITNSGQANAATGQQGVLHNLQMAKTIADYLECQPEQILTASTGVIGERLNIEKIMTAIPELVNSVSTIAEKFALAIMTTDLVPKTVCKKIKLSQGEVCITGIAKGSGMIHPNMATMLGYLLTDAKLMVPQAEYILKEVCDKSFNMISVDGESSTNDCVFLLANGMSGVCLSTEEDQRTFHDAMEEVAITLAKAIARDGEGASKLIQVTVQGLSHEFQAKQLARWLTTSILIKTAIYGESPNWGRILARLGSWGLTAQAFSACEILTQNLVIYKNGEAMNVDLAELKKKMKSDTIEIVIKFHLGSYSAVAWGCDLSEKYVSINAEYVS